MQFCTSTLLQGVVVFATALLFSTDASNVAYAQDRVARRADLICSAVPELRAAADVRFASNAASAADLNKALDALTSDRSLMTPACPAYRALSTQIAVVQFRIGEMKSAEQTIAESFRSP